MMLLLSMVLMTGIMTGCKSDDNGLSGVYAEIDGSGFGYAYYFVNDNTVKWCYCHDGYKAPKSDDRLYQPGWQKLAVFLQR